MQHAEGFLKIVNDAKSRIREISPSETQQKLNRGDVFQLIDVREDNEWDKGRAKEASHLGKGIIKRDIEGEVPTQNQKMVLSCAVAQDTSSHVKRLTTMQYLQLYF